MTIQGSELVRLLADPAGVAVIGASADPRRPAGRPLGYLAGKGFSGRLVAVNPRHSTIAGVPCVASVAAIEPGTVEVAVVTLAAPQVVPALEQAAAAGVRVAVVIGSGFEDATSEPRLALEKFADSSSLRIIGPNCVGTLSVRSGAYLTFSSVLRTATPRIGHIGLVTQSGALGNSLLQSLIRRHVGLSQWVSTGNETDAGALEIVAGMLSQPDMDTVGLFLEGITDIGWLPAVEAALRNGGKSLFVLKGAQTSGGRAAAAGHTGRVVGSADASRAILRESGAHEVSTVSALADALVVSSAGGKLPLAAPARVSIVTVSGAAGVLGADHVAQDPRTVLATAAPEVAALDDRLIVANPLDVPFLDQTSTFAEAIDVCASSSDTDVVVAVESGLAHDRQELAAVLESRTSTTPILLTSLSEDDPVPSEVTERLADVGVVYLPTIDRAIAALRTCTMSDRTAGDTDRGPTPDAGSGSPVYEVGGLEVAASLVPESFPWARWSLVAGDHPESVLAATDVPVVVKAAGRTIEHRSDVGAIELVREADELLSAWRRVDAVSSRLGDAVVLQEVVAPGFEVMVSAVHDPEFGPVAFLRPGGVFADLMDAQCVIWGMWAPERRTAVLAASTFGSLLAGYRGGPTYDSHALLEVVSTCLQIINPSVPLIELNPVVVHTRSVRVLDAVVQRSVSSLSVGGVR
jgi:acyl-CoA synthetase (NDP forming)